MKNNKCKGCMWYGRLENEDEDRCHFMFNYPKDEDKYPDCFKKKSLKDVLSSNCFKSAISFLGVILKIFAILIAALFEIWALKYNAACFFGSLLLLFFSWLFIPVRLVLLHPIKTFVYGLRDSWFYFIHKEYNFLQAGKLDAYVAEFGGGKTLSIAHEVVRLYDKYNNVKVWDRGRKCFVMQKVHVVSNVDFSSIPYEPLSSLSQVVNMTKVNRDVDKINNTRTVVLVVLDEASVQLNSRSFKDNIDPLFLNTLLTCRHYHISIFYSSQKFNLTDKLLRDVTQRVIWCNKIWRLMCQDVFNADDMEYASNPLLVKPIKRTGFFITNKDYAAYDTLACVDNLKKKVDLGDMMSEQEILEMRGELNPDNDNVTRRSWRLKRRQRHK